MAFNKYIDPTERKIINHLLRHLLKQPGCKIMVHDGEEWATGWSDNYEELTSAIGHTDYTSLRVRFMNGTQVESKGWIDLIHGNHFDVVSDYSTSLEEYMRASNRFVDQLMADRVKRNG